MSIPIYNQNGHVYIDQSIPTGESSNKLANAKFVVDTVNAKVDNFRIITDNSFSQVVTPIKNTTDASFVKLGDGTLVVAKAAKVANKITIGTSEFDGSASVSLPNVNIDGNAGLANHLNNSSSGIVYQSSANQTNVLNYSGINKLLQSNATGNEIASVPAPTWVDPNQLTVGKATNIAGGTAGRIPYQRDVSSTSFTEVGTPGQLLQSNNAGTPTWVNPSSITGLTVTNIAGAGNGKFTLPKCL